MDKEKENNDKEQDNKRTEPEQEFNFDFSRLKKALSNKKVNAILITTLLILIPVVLTVYIRLLPESLPQTDNWAQSSVDNYFRNQIAGAINSQYPNLPQQNKDVLINQQFAEFKKNNQAMLDQQVKETSGFFKQGFQYYENNYTYTFLGDLDSYFYLRQARNIEQKGMVCDAVVAGECWDTYLLAPLGGPVSASLHPYGIFILYKSIHFINPANNLMRASFFLPTVLSVLSAIAAFFLGKRLMNQVAGFFAAMFVALSPMMITRTLGSDTDIWNITLPLIIVWVFVEAFEANTLVKKSILAVLSGLLMGIFSFAWGGWWYLFDFIIAAMIGYFAITLVKNYYFHRSLKKLFNEELKLNLIFVGVLVVSSIVFVGLFTSFGTVMSVLFAPFSTFTTLKAAAKPDLWPNVFTTVAELNEANIASVVSQTAFGMNWLFAIALLGIVLTMIKRVPDWKDYILICSSAVLFLYLTSNSAFNLSTTAYLGILLVPVLAAALLYLLDKHTDVDIKPALLFTIWFVGMIIASIKGVRFILLLTPIFAIAVGVAIGYAFQYLSRIVKNELKINESVAKLAVFLILCLILIMPLRAGLSAGENFTPSMTKGWWDSLSKIRMESQPDAIINSWWDFGHWFKYVADRRVTLDGVTQNSPNAHWLGLILQTNNEREAIGILRMLDCGSNNAFEEVNKKFNDTEKSENIVSQLIKMDKEDGEDYLDELEYSNEEIKKISSYLYCEPPENYFITSGDMVGKAGVWAHFGLWNFDRAYMINEVRPKSLEEGTTLLKERFNYTDQEATSIYYELQSLQTDREMNDWIAGWPNYFTGGWAGCIERNVTTNDTEIGEEAVYNRTLLCPINMVIGQTADSRTVIEGAIYDFENPRASTIVVSTFDSAGVRRGSGTAVPNAYVVMEEEDINKINFDNVTIGLDVIIDTVEKRLLITDPQLSESMFTKLFYLDGRYTEHFEKFSDVTDITGTRIIVWKVKW